MACLEPCVVFDLDGVVIESEVHWHDVTSEFLRGLVTTWSDADQSQILGMSGYDVHRLLVEKYDISLTQAEYLDYYQGIAEEIYGHLAAPVPGALKLINELSSEGFALAIATSSPRTWLDIVIRRFELARVLQFSLSADDTRFICKPNPAIYLEAQRRFGCKANNIIAIEDSEKGIISAKSAGIHCIALRTKSNQKHNLSLADLRVDSLSELTAARIKTLFSAS